MEDQPSNVFNVRITKACKDAMAGADEKNMNELRALFSEAVQQASSQGDKELKDYLILVVHSFSFYLKSSGDGPYGPMFVMADGRRSYLPEDFSSAELDKIDQLSRASEAPALIARLTDILWLRRKLYPQAQKSIRAHLNCVDVENKPWVEWMDYLRRAAQIANEIGRQGEEFELVVSKVSSLLDNFETKYLNEKNSAFLGSSLINIAITERLFDNVEALGNRAAKIAENISHSTHATRSYFKLAAKCFQKAKKPEKEKAALVANAKNIEEEADRYAREGREGLVLMHWYNQAIQAYRRVGGMKEKENELLNKLKMANKLAISQMKPIRYEIDIKELIEFGREAMAGHKGTDALSAFVTLVKPTSYEKARKEAGELNKEFPLQGIFGASTIAPEGNITEKTPGSLEAPEEALKAKIIRGYNLNQSLEGGVTLREAIAVIKQEDPNFETTLISFVSDHPAIPDDRKTIFVRAFIAGFEGDGLVFMHLIIPQIEFLIRNLFEIKGLQITAFDREGKAQREKDLNVLLTDADAAKILGEELLWEFRSLLIEQTGPNIRNRVCHGLMNAPSCEGSLANYLLWLSLYLLFCLKKVLPSAEENKSDAASGEELGSH